MASLIKCRFCPWSTPVWVGRTSGWRRLASHIVDKHTDVTFKPLLVAYGTTGKGIDVQRRHQDAD